MGLVDTLVVGRAGTQALAAVGLANALFFAVGRLRHGADDGRGPVGLPGLRCAQRARARALLWQGGWMALFAGAGAGRAVMLVPELLPLFGTRGRSCPRCGATSTGARPAWCAAGLPHACAPTCSRRAAPARWWWPPWWPTSSTCSGNIVFVFGGGGCPRASGRCGTSPPWARRARRWPRCCARAAAGPSSWRSRWRPPWRRTSARAPPGVGGPAAGAPGGAAHRAAHRGGDAASSRSRASWRSSWARRAWERTRSSISFVERLLHHGAGHRQRGQRARGLGGGRAQHAPGADERLRRPGGRGRLHGAARRWCSRSSRGSCRGSHGRVGRRGARWSCR